MFVAALPFNVDNVMSVLTELAEKWKEVGDMLHVPETTLNNIKCAENGDKLWKCVIYWMQRDLEASWRKLIYRLDWSDDKKLQQTARKFTKKPLGQSVSHYNNIAIVASCILAVLNGGKIL